MKRQKQTLQAKKCGSSILAINISGFLAISILCGLVMASTTNANASTASTASTTTKTTTTQSKSEAIQNAKSNLDRFNANPKNFVSFLSDSNLAEIKDLPKEFFQNASNNDFQEMTWKTDYWQEESEAISNKTCKKELVFIKKIQKKIEITKCLQKKNSRAKFARPTIYYIPEITEKKDTCTGNKVTSKLVDYQGKFLLQNDSIRTLTMCKSSFSSCSIEGSCFFKQPYKSKDSYYLNGSGKPAFELLDSKKFPYGKGLGNGKTDGLQQLFDTDSSLNSVKLNQALPLDPFYTIAADTPQPNMSINHFVAGDVLFFPTLVGLILPDGTKHNGFMIVRDTGAKSIFGGRANRFDFFSGNISPYNTDNPFHKLELSQEILGKRNSDLTFPFYIVAGKTKLEILKWRNYPLIPQLKVTK